MRTGARYHAVPSPTAVLVHSDGPCPQRGPSAVRAAARAATLAVMTTERRSQRRPAHRISGPAELLQAVPYLLGFHPARSLVLVGLDDGVLVVTARLDLSDAARGAIPNALYPMLRGGSTCVVAAIYDDDAGPLDVAELPWTDVAVALEEEAFAAGCEVLDTMLVVRGRWWSYACASPACCPPEGRPLPAAPSPFAAAATYQGVVALPDREALEALLDPLPPPDRQRLDAEVEAAEHAAVQDTLDGHGRRYERSAKRALFAAARESADPRWTGPPDAEVARYGVALTSIPIRDSLWMAVDDGRLDGRALWRDLARRLPSPYDAAALFLFGWAAWRAGDGTLAGIAAERAVASDPAYTAADLLLAAVANGVDPRRLPKLRLPRSA